MMIGVCKRGLAVAFVICAGLGFASSSAAVATAWTTAASAGLPVYDSAAVVLQTGKVLVVGGFQCCTSGYGNPQTTPTLYDPASNTWTGAGNTVFQVINHSVTLLPSGKVLVAGGWTSSQITSAAQLYDPATNSWSSAAAMNSPHAYHTAVLLPSGKVLIAGGYVDDFSTPSATAELYDPATNTWQVTGSLLTARDNHTATLLQSGKVLVTGGFGGGTLAVAEIYDPQTGSWSAATALPIATTLHTATLLPSGKVMVCGGVGPAGILASTQFYDPKSNAWTLGPAIPTARDDHNAVLLPSGQVLVSGGATPVYTATTSSWQILNSTELYDPVANQWTAGPLLNEARTSHTANVLPSGNVVITGGDNNTNFLASTEVLNTTVPKNFNSLQPARLLETRPGWTTSDGSFNGTGKLGLGGKLDLTVANRGGLPASGIGAVVLNVTVVNPTAAGYLTVWPADGAQPTASNLNFTPGQTTANLVIAKASADGKVSIFNSAGTTDVIADVVGWFPVTSGLTSLNPARVLDTRASASTIDNLFAGLGAMNTATTGDLTVAGRGGIPFAAVGSVLLNVTATDATAPGYLTVWPQGTLQPYASNLNFVPAQTVPNLVFAQASSSGQVSIYNSAGTTDVIADVVGWLPQGSELNPVAPSRLLDTRAGMTTSDSLFAGIGALPSQGALSLTVVGRGGVPATGVGTVVLNVTVTNPTGTGYLTVWPSGTAQPNASNLNFIPNQTVANLVIAKIGADGAVALFNSAGSTDVVADIVGWFP
jgi:N-acetylneuraminic acid mutarotase